MFEFFFRGVWCPVLRIRSSFHGRIRVDMSLPTGAIASVDCYEKDLRTNTNEEMGQTVQDLQRQVQSPMHHLWPLR